MPKDKRNLGKKAVLIILGVLILDQIVKIWVKTQMDPGDEGAIPIISGFIQLFYIENPGMAFGTTLGNGAGPKYALSIFRLLAISGIAYYMYKLLKEGNVSMGMIVSLSLIFAGATGNLIDGMFYDYIWDLDPTIRWNWAIDENNAYMLTDYGAPVLRDSGFLLGSVVDMFQFTVKWPSWMPFDLGGKEIFAAIWNVADFSISLGVGLIILKYRKFFSKPVKEEDGDDSSEEKRSPIESPLSEAE
jgi:signal peptidase II